MENGGNKENKKKNENLKIQKVRIRILIKNINWTLDTIECIHSEKIN